MKCKNSWCVSGDEEICSYCGCCLTCCGYESVEGSCASNLGYETRGDFISKIHKHNSFVDASDIKTIVCKKCNSDRWIVGQVKYETVIKCRNCGYEVNIHSG